MNENVKRENEIIKKNPELEKAIEQVAFLVRKDSGYSEKQDGSYLRALLNGSTLVDSDLIDLINREDIIRKFIIRIYIILAYDGPKGRNTLSDIEVMGKKEIIIPLLKVRTLIEGIINSELISA